MFWQARKGEDEDMRTAADMVELVASLSDGKLLKRFLLKCLAINLLVWVVAVVFAGPVYRIMSVVLSSKFGMLFLGIPLVFGMFLTYCLLRLKFSTIEETRMLDSELMGSYSYQRESSRHWMVWVLSVLGGVLNVLFLIATNLYFAGVV